MVTAFLMGYIPAGTVVHFWMFFGEVAYTPDLQGSQAAVARLHLVHQCRGLCSIGCLGRSSSELFQTIGTLGRTVQYFVHLKSLTSRFKIIKTYLNLCSNVKRVSVCVCVKIDMKRFGLVKDEAHN